MNKWAINVKGEVTGFLFFLFDKWSGGNQKIENHGIYISN